MKKITAVVQLIILSFTFGCGGMLHTPPTTVYYSPLKQPYGYSLAIGKFDDNSFARYPLFITGKELQALFGDVLERNRAFKDVYAVNIKKKDDAGAIDEKAREKGAALIMEGEISESECHFVGSNALGVPMYLLIATVFGFPIGFNIKAQTWEGKAEVNYRIRELPTGKIVFKGSADAVAYRNFSIWEERTERQLSKNFVRRMLTPLVLQNLKAAVAKDICTNFAKSDTTLDE